MRSSRSPDEVHEWLDDKVAQGFDQKAIKTILQMTSDELAEVTVILFKLHNADILLAYK